MLKLSLNSNYNGETSPLFTHQAAKQTRTFHQQIDGYQPTPLVSLPTLAQHLGVKAILVKDKSKRFGLNAFKVLGGSYALGRLLADHLNMDISEIDLKTVSEKLPKPLVFTTATAGNHGLGAECIVTDVNYDDTVRLASQTADENGWTLVQDTAWKGYETIPTWISQGYITMADEALEQAQADNMTPTHIMLQAGVGAMAGGVLGYFADALGADNFKAIIGEPSAADCIFRSADAGDLTSIMAGLACGEPNPVTWPILRNCSDACVSADDNIAALGMRILGNPLKGDQAVISGESGAITTGILY